MATRRGLQIRTSTPSATRAAIHSSRASAFTEKVVREGTTLYRARFSGFEEGDSAQAACKTLKRSGFNCFATRS